MIKFSAGQARSGSKKELTDLQKRRLLVIQAKEIARKQEEVGLLSNLQEYVVTLMDSRVEEIENALVENGVYNVDKEIGHLRANVVEEIQELREFWERKGVTIALGGYEDIIHGEFTLQFQLNV